MKPSLLLLCCCFVLPAFCQPLNLNFEEHSYADATQPWAWYPATYGSPATVQLDSTQRTEGKYSLKIAAYKTDSLPGPFTYQFILEPKYLTGHKLRLTGNIRSNDISDKAVIMLAQYTGENYTLQDAAKAEFKGTTAWKKFEISFTPDDSVRNMSIEITLTAYGELWLDDLRLSIDQKQVTEILTAPLFSESEKRSLQNLCTPFSGTDDLHDFKDLAFFKPLAGEATIIGLGESTHGTSEFFRLKHRMLAYAVEELGVRVFALEDNMLSVELINHYVLTGEGDPAALINNLFGVWNNQEVLAMINWVRSYNALHTNSPVEFIGIDVQDIRLPLDSLYAFLNRRDPALYAQVKELLPGLSKNWWEIYSLSENEKLNWRNKSEESFALVEAQQKKWLGTAKNRKDSTAVYYGVQYAKLVKQFAENNYLPYTTFFRDSAMAANIMWQLSIRRPGTKMLLWAHDAHINKGSSPVAENNYYNSLSMGSYLHRWLGDKYTPFGLSTYAGAYRCVKSYSDFTWTTGFASPSPSGSIDKTLHEISVAENKPFLFLDLRQVLKDTIKYSAVLEARPVRMNNHVSIDYTYGDLVSVPYAFNGIFFIDSTTAAKEN